MKNDHVLSRKIRRTTIGLVASGLRTPDAPRARGIPTGHLPPPGACQMWFDGCPFGQQPPPGDCGELRYHVQPGERLIYG